MLSDPQRTKPAGHVSAIDPLRGMAALAVALFHFTNNGWLPPEHWLTRLGFFGHYGVRTFLVISGFVVPYAMWMGGYTVGSLPAFLARRFTRIHPPYLASALFLLASRQWNPAGNAQQFDGWDLAGHLVLANEALGRPWLMTVYWTLALEAQFYLFAGLAWPLLVTRRQSVFAAIAVFGLVAGVVWPGNAWLVGKAAYFLLGLALFRQHAGLDKTRTSVGLIALIAAAIGRWDGAAALIAALLPVIAKFAIDTVSTTGRHLGRVSYSLYLFHLLAGTAFLNFLAPWVTSTFWRCALVPVALALALVAAELAYRWIESPSIRWSRRFRYHAR